jgi:peroxiredoxin
MTETIPELPPTPTPKRGLNPILLVFLIFPIIGLIGALSVGMVGGNGGLVPPQLIVTSDSLIGRNAPDFELETFAGGKVRLSDLRGKVTFLNFWAVYCAPCRIEMPVFQALIDGKIEGEGQVLTVNRGDRPEQVRQFFADIKVNLPTAMDTKITVNDLYRVVNLPITYIIDKEGVIRERHIGIINADAVIAYLKKYGGAKS